MTKRALITGICGQDGAYLAEFLLKQKYNVVGICRTNSNPWRLKKLGVLGNERLTLRYGSIGDLEFLRMIRNADGPFDEVYNLAAETFVGSSWDQTYEVTQTNAVGALNVLNAFRTCGFAHIYQASSSEMFGHITEPANEKTPMKPASPYGVAKLYAHEMADVYRQSYGTFVSCGILFNHESPFRGSEFVTSAIVRKLRKNKSSGSDTLVLGNVDSVRDWGHAKDYVRAMWLMLQQSTPKDYVVASGEPHTIKEFVEEACVHLGMAPPANYVENAKLKRPNDITWLCGDSTLARKELGWKPEYSFEELVKDMALHSPWSYK